MARRLSAKKLATEYLRRQLAFHKSGMSGYKHGMVLNREGCPRTTDVEVVELVRTGLARIVRHRQFGRTSLTKTKNARHIGRAQKNWTTIELIAQVQQPVDITCPGCGENFAVKSAHDDRWFTHQTVRNNSFHAFDCPLRVDHYLDAYQNRSNEIKQRSKGLKSRPYRGY